VVQWCLEAGDLAIFPFGKVAGLDAGADSQSNLQVFLQRRGTADMVGMYGCPESSAVP
jgi:hypothetical protein